MWESFLAHHICQCKKIYCFYSKNMKNHAEWPHVEIAMERMSENRKCCGGNIIQNKTLWVYVELYVHVYDQDYGVKKAICPKYSIDLLMSRGSYSPSAASIYLPSLLQNLCIHILNQAYYD